MEHNRSLNAGCKGIMELLVGRPSNVQFPVVPFSQWAVMPKPRNMAVPEPEPMTVPATQAEPELTNEMIAPTRIVLREVQLSLFD